MDDENNRDEHDIGTLRPIEDAAANGLFANIKRSGIEHLAITRFFDAQTGEPRAVLSLIEDVVTGGVNIYPIAIMLWEEADKILIPPKTAYPAGVRDAFPVLEEDHNALPLPKEVDDLAH